MKTMTRIGSLLLLGVLLPLYAKDGRGLRTVKIQTHDGGEMRLYEGSYALVIGVSEYSDPAWPDLETVPGEVRKVSRAFEQQGFEVRQVMNPDKKTLEEALEGFVEDHGYQKENRLLIYFAGHGHSDGGKGFLVPSDAPDPAKDAADFKRKALFMNDILNQCRKMAAKHALFLFDSCFSGTVFQSRDRWKAPPKHIATRVGRPVRQFISAGSAQEAVPSKSVFAPTLVRGLEGDADLNKDGYITGQELGVFLHDEVVHYEKGQTPQYGKIKDPELDQGDFVFEVRQVAKRASVDEPEPATRQVREVPESEEVSAEPPDWWSEEVEAPSGLIHVKAKAVSRRGSSEARADAFQDGLERLKDRITEDASLRPLLRLPGSDIAREHVVEAPAGEWHAWVVVSFPRAQMAKSLERAKKERESGEYREPIFVCPIAFGKQSSERFPEVVAKYRKAGYGNAIWQTVEDLLYGEGYEIVTVPASETRSMLAEILGTSVDELVERQLPRHVLLCNMNFFEQNTESMSWGRVKKQKHFHAELLLELHSLHDRSNKVIPAKGTGKSEDLLDATQDAAESAIAKLLERKSKR